MKLSNQLKKASKTSNIVIGNGLLTTDLMVNNANNSGEIFPATLPNTSAIPSDNSIIEENIKRQVVESLNGWCQKMKETNDQKMFQLKENIDYEIFIDIIGMKMLIKCRCGKAITLGQKDNTYIVCNLFSKIRLLF